jgi:hypothetical protein
VYFNVNFNVFGALAACSHNAENIIIDMYNVTPVGSSVGALYQKLYIQSKVLLRMGGFVARNT